MKNLKHLILTLSLVICSFAIQSCTKEEPVRTYDAIVTIKPNPEERSVIFQLDENTAAYPVNYSGSDFSSVEQRALINYREPTAEERNKAISQGNLIYVNWIQFILTKDMVPDLGPENNEMEYGDDPIELVNDWVTLAEDGYLNLRFRTLWGDRGITHKVNLVYTPEDDNPYCVTFYHDSMGDDRFIENDGIDSWRRKAWIKTFDEVLYWMNFRIPAASQLT